MQVDITVACQLMYYVNCK